MRTRFLAPLLISAFPASAGESAPSGPVPEALRPDLEVELFSSEPEIATPIAIDVDPRGRVWAIESNTHFQDPGYPRHPTDRVLVIEDTDGDGRADRHTTFADGLRHAMGLALERKPHCVDSREEAARRIILATRREVLVLEDSDGDGRADGTTRLARLETVEEYPHNGLSGFAFDDLGFIYFAIGENMGVPYVLTGADGSESTGGPDGGSIFRMRRDGTCLERWATGFWNTFHMATDAFGRLFAVDNDPDSRPPCRLLHIVRGGDYGYRRWLGRKGLHPFTSWNGELPGTLPMVSGTGEAPSGILAYEETGLPEDLRGTLIVTSWGDHRLEVHRLEERGASFRSRPETIVRGGELFRPVGIAAAPDGTIYFSDWVDKEYHVHGKGRIWRLLQRGERGQRGSERAPANGVAGPGKVSSSGAAVSPGARGRSAREAAALDLARRSGGRPEGSGPAREAARAGPSPRERYHALCALAAMGSLLEGSAILGESDPDPAVRAAAVRLASGAREIPHPVIRRLLADPSPAVRLEAVLASTAATVEEGAALADAIDLAVPPEDPFLVGASIDAWARLAGPSRLAAKSRQDDPRRRLEALLALRRLKPAARDDLRRLLADPDPEVRRAAVQWAGEERLVEERGAIEQAMRGPISRETFDACLAALGLLAGEAPDDRDTVASDEFLLRAALETDGAPEIRAMALRSVGPLHPGLTEPVLRRLLADPAPALRIEAVRTLREIPGAWALGMLLELAAGPAVAPAVRREAIPGLAGGGPAAKDVLEKLRSASESHLRAEAERALRFSAPPGGVEGGDLPVREDAPRAVLTPAASQALLAGGDPAEGEVLFFYPRGPRCSSCHSVRGRGGRAGPDLSAAGHAPRSKIIESILEPGKDVSPQYSTWVIETADGVRAGTLLGEDPDGALRLADATGAVTRIPATDLRSRTLSGTSMMPDDIAGLLTLDEIRHLAAFLESMK